MDSAAPSLDTAFDELEASILPNLSLILDGLLDAAGTARAGIDAHRYATEIRMLSLGVAELTRQVEALAPIAAAAVQAPARLRMSA
jgi:outer membrane murein-binding lipoprotein Lpp